MNESKITVRYARALLKSAIENKNEDKIYEDSQIFLKILQNTEFLTFLTTPKIKKTDKKDVLKSIEKYFNPIFNQFLAIIIDNSREKYLPLILLNYRRFYLETKNIKEAELIVAKDIDESVKQKIHDQIKHLTKTEVEFDVKVKPQIIGGFIIKIQDKQLDLSVKTQLKKLKSHILK